MTSSMFAYQIFEMPASNPTLASLFILLFFSSKHSIHRQQYIRDVLCEIQVRRQVLWIAGYVDAKASENLLVSFAEDSRAMCLATFELLEHLDCLVSTGVVLRGNRKSREDFLDIEARSIVVQNLAL